MNKTCSECRHFDPPDDTWTLGYGKCNLAEGGPYPLASTLPIAEMVEYKRRGETPPDWPPLYASDASGYHAVLNVLPTFGCNEWTSR